MNEKEKVLKGQAELTSPITEQLQSLSLQSNKISRFPTASLRPLHQLKTLHLNDNNVSAWVMISFFCYLIFLLLKSLVEF